MKATDIIELDDGNKFLLVSEAEYKGEKFFLAQRMDDNDKLIEADYQVFRAGVEDGEEYVDLVENKKLIDELSKEFAKELGN